jgi:hypothetical protein
MQFIVHNCKHYMQDLFLVLWYPNLDENFKKLANSFLLYATKHLIWIKHARGIKLEHQNEEGTKTFNVFHNMWRLNFIQYKIMEMETLFTR